MHKRFEPFFDQKDIENTISSRNRCLLTYEILSRTSYSKASQSISEKNADSTLRGIGSLLANKTFQAAFPPHKQLDKSFVDNLEIKTRRQYLWNYWANPKKLFTYQPLNAITEYLGEKLGFYFAWLGFYTSSLMLPAIFGLIAFIVGLSTLSNDKPTKDICDQFGVGNRTMCPLCDEKYCKVWKLQESCTYSKFTYLIDNPATVVYSLLMAVWTVLFMDFWKRKQAYLQFEWDTFDYEKNYETTRPQFEQNVKNCKKNQITGV